jgi:hypothetical protein
MSTRRGLMRTDTSNLADVLERVLDKGIVIAGDITVRLVDVELLTIQLRLVITSVDKARELGMDWWRRGSDRSLARALEGRADQQAELAELRHRVAQLEQAATPASEAGMAGPLEPVAVRPALDAQVAPVPVRAGEDDEEKQ